MSLIHHPRPYALERLERGGRIYVSSIDADCSLPSWQAIARHSSMIKLYPRVQFYQVKSRRRFFNVTVVDDKDWSSWPASAVGTAHAQKSWPAGRRPVETGLKDDLTVNARMPRNTNIVCENVRLAINTVKVTLPAEMLQTEFRRYDENWKEILLKLYWVAPLITDPSTTSSS